MLLFALKNWKTIAAGVGIVVVISTIGFHLMMDNRRAAQIVALTANNTILEQSIKTQQGLILQQQDALVEWSEAMDGVQETIQDMADAQVEANEQSRRLNDVLGKHDLEALSLAKPGLIERTINRASSGVFRMLNDETSGDLHEDD